MGVRMRSMVRTSSMWDELTFKTNSYDRDIAVLSVRMLLPSLWSTEYPLLIN